MTVEAAIFRCSICGEPSSEICVFCTKDTCGNHRCGRCKGCSDCCECEVPLSADEVHAPEPEAEPTEATESHAAEPPSIAEPPQDSAPLDPTVDTNGDHPDEVL